MTDLAPLEQSALKAIFATSGFPIHAADEYIGSVTVLSRENTGGGFFTYLKAVNRIPDLSGYLPSSCDNVWISVEGMSYGLGMILNFKKHDCHWLEGYAVAPEDTRLVDFTHMAFAIAPEPKPYVRPR